MWRCALQLNQFVLPLLTVVSLNTEEMLLAISKMADLMNHQISGNSVNTTGFIIDCVARATKAARTRHIHQDGALQTCIPLLGLQTKAAKFSI